MESFTFLALINAVRSLVVGLKVSKTAISSETGLEIWLIDDDTHLAIFKAE